MQITIINEKLAIFEVLSAVRRAATIVSTDFWMDTWTQMHF